MKISQVLSVVCMLLRYTTAAVYEDQDLYPALYRGFGRERNENDFAGYIFKRSVQFPESPQNKQATELSYQSPVGILSDTKEAAMDYASAGLLGHGLTGAKAILGDAVPSALSNTKAGLLGNGLTGAKAILGDAVPSALSNTKADLLGNGLTGAKAILGDAVSSALSNTKAGLLGNGLTGAKAILGHAVPSALSNTMAGLLGYGLPGAESLIDAIDVAFAKANADLFRQGPYLAEAKAKTASSVGRIKRSTASYKNSTEPSGGLFKRHLDRFRRQARNVQLRAWEEESKVPPFEPKIPSVEDAKEVLQATKDVRNNRPLPLIQTALGIAGSVLRGIGGALNAADRNRNQESQITPVKDTEAAANGARKKRSAEAPKLGLGIAGSILEGIGGALSAASRYSIRGELGQAFELFGDLPASRLLNTGVFG